MPDKATADNWTSWLKLALIAAFPTYLVLDSVLGYVFEDTRQQYRSELCFRFEDEADEEVRRRNLPVTVLGKFDHFLKCASLKEVSLLGGKITNEEIIRKKLESSEEKAQTLATIAELEAQIKKLRKADTSGTRTARADAQIDNALKSADETRGKLVTSLRQVEQQISKLASIAPEIIPFTDSWVIVAGGFRVKENAITEARKLDILFKDASRQRQIPIQTGAFFLLRNDLNRIVFEFADRNAAQTALNNLIKQLPNGAYIRGLQSWCPGAQPAPDLGGFRVLNCDAAAS